MSAPDVRRWASSPPDARSQFPDDLDPLAAGSRPESWRDAQAGTSMDELARWRRRGVELPDSVARLLLGIGADGFTVYCCGAKADPAALVASYEWPHHVDLVTIRDLTRRVAAARVPKPGAGRVDVFAPGQVVWSYEGPAEPTLRAVLNLVHPAHPDAPTHSYPAPCALSVPRREQRPLSIRLPSPARAHARATRLLAGLRAAQVRG
ncbi:MAG: hypothetical protein ACRDTE_16030 [Pseudonocardiaceae bacterium]